MNRTRDYYRKMRAKHIARKKNIIHNYWHWYSYGYEYYPYDGMYSKNKIHCSCPLCSERARNNGKHVKTMQEIKSDISAQEQISEAI